MQKGTIDVVYKLGIGSNSNDAELRYSLRSLKNFLPLRNVYLIGHCPIWIQNVIHIPINDPYLTNKDGNLISKLILATTDPNLSDEFINISDDQLFMQETSYEDVKTPYINNKLIVDTSNGKRPNRWQIRLNETIDILKKRNLPHDCFEAHIPYLHSKKDYARTLFQYDYGFGRGFCGNTLYYNTLKIKGRDVEPTTLTRLESVCESVETLEILCSGKRFLNYQESVVNEKLFLYLRNQFPDKSIYEK